MKKTIAFFSTKDFEQYYFSQHHSSEYEFIFHRMPLSEATASLGKDCIGCCCFVTDDLSESVLRKLASLGVELITLRSAGYDHVDLTAAKKYHLTVMRVSKYSPESVAEFAVALILALSRNLIKAYENNLRYDFRLDALIGFNLNTKTLGIIGTGNIGTAFARIIQGFGSRLKAYDIVKNAECVRMGVEYVSLDNLLQECDIVSLHCPLTPQTFHLIDAKALAIMKKSAMLINTGRGGLVDTCALIASLKKGQIKYAGLDVYEKEKGLFFYDLSQEKIQDQDFLTLQSLPNVFITPHQAFLTEESLENITKTTIENINSYLHGHYKGNINLL